MDSSMVKASANNFGLPNSGMSVEEFKEQAIETHRFFMLPGPTADADGAGNVKSGISEIPWAESRRVV